MTEPGRHGPLPRISADGRTPIRTYGRPFDRADTRPRIAIIVGDFGLNASHSDDALRRLPVAVSLAITPYGYGLPAWSERARERGMETLIAIPMEPAGFPMNDPGDRALLTSLSLPENLDRLSWTLSRTQGYAGAIGAIGNMRGERFAQSGEAFLMVQDSLQGRGLLYIDPRPGARNPARAWGRAVDLVIDEPATRGEIERRLTVLEGIARERGSALGLAGSPTPVLVERLAAWGETLAAKGLALAPASILIRRPDGIVSENRTP
ncbi:divergent polysaccharide deacetylase family protein [Plastoroseomonas arctica]|uniref:Divergent polysaccharide deacetylase family protein n=1 Tax=Plastoroseomonas arctica TaxID=1509237 RepID=A0AAF1K5R6_9PROT|nr:divergent polysaccharide deacetylase family protein [Plastoroseomonas arctica]MBR0656855.1 divergent polysaccharide deacetylase family protein [Plastoroseomonas arctica]